MRHHPWRHPIASWTRLLLLCVVLFISWPTDHPSFLVAALDRTSPLPRELHLREMEALRDDDDDEEDGEGGGPTLDHPTDGATFNDYPTLTEVVRQLRWAAQSPTHNPRGDPAYHHFRGVGSRGGPPPHDAKKARREEEEVAATSQHPQPSSAESSPSGGDAPSDLDERNPATDWLREFLFDDAAAVKSNASAALEWAHCFHLVPVFPVEAAMRRLNQQDDDDVFLGLFYAPDIFPIFNYVQWMELLVQLAYTLYALTGRVGRHPATEIDPRSMGTVEELGAKCFPDGLSLPTLLPEQVQLLTDHGVHVGLIDAYYPPQNITHKMLSILHNSISQQPRSGRRREARRGEVRSSSSASSVGWRRRRRRGWWRREAPAEADIDADGSFIMREEPLRSYHAEARAAELETLQRVLNEVPLSRTHQAALLERLLREKPEDVDHDDGDDSTTAGATSSQEKETPTAKGATPDEEDEATDDREAHKLLEHLQHAVDLTRRRQHRLAHIIFSHHQAVKYRVHANVSMLRQQGFSSEAVCTSPPPSMWRERPSTAGTTAVGPTGSVADSTKASFTSGEVAPNPRLSSDESQLHSPDNDRGVGEEEDEDEYLERSASTTHYYRSILRHLRRLRIQEGGGDDRAPAQHARDMMDKENREVARMNFLLGQLTPTMIWPRRQGCRPSFFPQTLLRLRSVHFHGRTQDPPSWNNHTNAEGVFWKAGEGGGKMRQRTYAVLGAEDNPFTRVAALYHNKEDVIEGPLQPAPVVGLLLDEAVSASSPGVLEMRRQRAQVYEERRVEWEMLHPRHNGDVGKLEEELVSGEDAEEDDGGVGRRRSEAGPTVATVRDYFFEHDLGIPIDPQRFAETAPLELQLFLRTSTEPLDTFMMVYLQAKMEGLRFALQHLILTEARRFGHIEWWRPQHVGNEPAGQWMEVACARCTHPMENHAGGVDDDGDDDDVAVAWHAIAHRPGVWRNFFGLFTSTPPRPSSPTEFVTAADGEKVAASAVMAVLHQNVSQLQQEPMWPCNCPRVVRRVGVMYLHHNRSAEDYIRVHPLNVQRVAIQRRLHTIQRLARQARLVLLKASEDDYRAQYVDDLMKGMLRQHRIMMEHSVPARDSPTTTP